MFGQMGELAGLMKRMGDMKTKMAEVKKELEQLSVTGSSWDGSVQITLAADMSVVRSVRVTKNIPASEMELAITEAVASAINNAKTESAKRLSEVTGGIDLSSLGL